MKKITKEEEKERLTFAINLLRELNKDEDIQTNLNDYYYLFGNPKDKEIYINDIIKGLETLMKIL